MNQYNDEITTEKSLMKANFGLAWINTELKGKTDIWSKTTFLNMFQGSFLCGSLTKDVNGRAFIEGYPKSLMKARYTLRPYPRESMQFTAIQDTFVDENRRSENFGEDAYVKVGNDGSGKYRGFIQFDISQLPTNLYIADAYLIIQSQDSRAFEGLEISGVDRSWKENSITWNGHPQRGKFYQVEESLDKTVTTYKIKVKDIIKDWYNGDEPNNGFFLKAYNEDKIQVKSFLSKEHGFESAPKLIVDYFDPEMYIPEGGKVLGHVSVESKKKDYKAFNGKIYVDKEDMYSKIRCKVRVYPDMIEATAKIAKWSDIKGKTIIRYFDETPKGTFEIIKDFKNEDFKGRAIISQIQIGGHVDVRIFNDGLKAKTIISDENDTLKGKIGVQGYNTRYDMKGVANIRFINDMKGVVEIFGTSVEQGIPKGRFTVGIENTELKGKVNVVFENTLLKGKVNVLVENNHLKGKLFTIVEKDLLKGKTEIVYGDLSLKGRSKIVANNDTFKSKVIITREHKAFDGKTSILVEKDLLKGKTIVTVDKIIGKLEVAIANNDLKGKFIVAHQNHIRGTVTVRYLSQIKGTVMVTSKMKEDIKAVVIIAENELYYENNCYSYIL